MWPFKMRAEPETKTETESSEDALLIASLADDVMTREQAMNVPTFSSCVNKIAEAILNCIDWMRRAVWKKSKGIAEWVC